MRLIRMVFFSGVYYTIRDSIRKNPALGFLTYLICTGVAIILHPDDRMNRSDPSSDIDLGYRARVETIQLQHMPIALHGQPYCSNFAIETNDGVLPNNTITVLPIMFCKI